MVLDSDFNATCDGSSVNAKAYEGGGAIVYTNDGACKIRDFHDVSASCYISDSGR